MPQRILFLEQQTTRAGGQRVLDEVFCALQPEFAPLVAFPGDGPYVNDLRRRSVETLTYPLGHYRSGSKSLADMMAFPLRSVYCAYRLAEIIRQRDVRLVYINGPRTLVAGVLAARLTGLPSLFHLHMTVIRGTDLLVASHAARRATRIVACSQTAAAALIGHDRRLEKKTQVIYSPVRQPNRSRTFEPQDDAASGVPRAGAGGAAVLGLVGRITPGKGHHVLLDAVARLVERGRDIQLVIVGAPDPNCAEDEAYLARLRTLARDLGLESRVRWAGYQSDPDPYYRTFDVLVMPSTVREGLGLVALEAMQWGVPVVGSRLGGILEVVRDGANGLLFASGDSTALAETLERLLTDSDLRARLQAGAGVSVDERFSVETFHARIRQLLFELCPSARPSPIPPPLRPAGTRA
ncbi:MAG TPA: glycosyltransferase family 4 protein [Terriglobia bacterium]|nr:glycosyltransferase family 4 protein [Terriglobia bacterium]